MKAKGLMLGLLMVVGASLVVRPGVADETETKCGWQAYRDAHPDVKARHESPATLTTAEIAAVLGWKRVCERAQAGMPPFVDPPDFRGVPWGADRATVNRAIFKGDPSNLCGSLVGGGVCGPLAIGDVSTWVIIGFSPDGGMESVRLSFPVEPSLKPRSLGGYAHMRGAFIEKYGEPTGRKTPMVQNRMGASFQDERLEWRGEKIVITLHKYAGSLTNSSAVIQTVEAESRKVDEYREQGKSGKKDL